MYRHILVPTDGSKLSAKALKSAIAVARPLGARLTALHVIAPWVPPAGDAMMYYVEAYSPEQYQKAAAAHARALLDKARAAAAAAGVRCESLVRTDPQPWAAIIKAARARGCDLIVMASHGRRGIAGVLLGSETAKVLTHSKTPVLVCR